MKKQLLFGIVLLLLLPIAFAESNPTDPCFGDAGPTSFIDIGVCMATTGMMGIDIALAVLFAIVLYSLFKYGAPMAVITPVMLVFAAVWIGYKLFTVPMQALFYYGLIIVSFFLVIGVIRLLYRS